MIKLFLVRWFWLIVLLIPALAEGQSEKVRVDKLESAFKVLRPGDRKMLVDGYAEAMGGTFLSEAEKVSIDSLFGALQKIPVSVQPELKNFVQCLIYFCREASKENLQVWLKGLREALGAAERKRIVVRAYLEQTGAFAGGQVVYRGSGHEWKVRGRASWSGGRPVRIDFEQADLLCTTPKDSIAIYGTRGYVLLGKPELFGKGGKVEWRPLKDSIRLELADYRIDLKAAGYTADSVWFHYASRYPAPLLGRLKDNALKSPRKKDTPYPEFSSYAKDIAVQGLYKNISYRGGVNYAGLNFIGEGTAEEPAVLEIVPNDTIAMRVSAQRFLFDSVRILSGKAAVSVDMDSGKISHPNLNFLYLIPKNTVTVRRITEQSQHQPFKDTYHQILFDVEEIVWPLDSPFMAMKMSNRSGLSHAVIESPNFFSDDVYDQIQGMDEINPLNGLLKCSQLLGSEVFTLGDYADFLKKPVDQLRKQVIMLSYKDFVGYDESRDEVTLKPRLYDYTRARVGKQDYDNIRFASDPPQSRVNALMDVRDYRLQIFGVQKFMISEARNIYVEPSDGQVVMMKNRDMTFNGRLNAGMFDMYGQNLSFSYEQYKIDMPQVDSTAMYLAGKDSQTRGTRVKALIRDLAGELTIDPSGNKSGKGRDAGSPVLNSKQDSYIYFDDPSIQQGEYARDKFYFVVKPYEIEDINDAGKLQYTFDGTLVSGIVSPIQDTLRLMENNTLGLVYETPAEGLELYGKGRIRSRIVLDRQGFQAKGEVDLNGSHFGADSILLLPTRMSAFTPDMKIDSVAGRRPGVSGKRLHVGYQVESGYLKASSTDLPFEIYGGRVRHGGSLLIRDTTLDASGKMELEDAVLQSDLLHLRENRISSEHARLSISSPQSQNIRLNTSDVKAEIDLTAHTGKFVNNVVDNQVEFASGYACLFNHFTWYMKEACLNIGMEDERQLAECWKMEDPDRLPQQGKNVFVATREQADSLTFVSPLTRYDLNTGAIVCQWVNHIDLANGRFYPRDGKVFIAPDGTIRDFAGGKLLCDREDTARVLTDVELSLQGRLHFRGAGNYVYVSEEEQSTPIRFTGIGTDSSDLILAEAEIGEEQPLLLNEGFRFKGRIALHSRRPQLFFAGYAGLTDSANFLHSQWMRVDSYLDRSHIRIPVGTENRNDRRERIYNGVFLYADKTFRPYAAFLSDRQFYGDELLIGGEGLLEWSAPMRQYIISDTLADLYRRFRYDPEDSTVMAYGPLNVDLRIPGMRQQAAGTIAYRFRNRELKMSDLLYLFDFSLLPKLEAALQKDFAARKAMRVSGALKEKIYELYGKGQQAEWTRQLARSADNVPDSLGQLFVLDSLDLSWDARKRLYVADGDVMVRAVRGKPVDQLWKIKLELWPLPTGNRFFMYIYNDQKWYYFEYAAQTLYTLSSNEEYNEWLETEKAGRKVIQTKDREILYTIELCPEAKKERFLRTMP